MKPFDLLQHMLHSPGNVMDFGAVGNGITDDTDAFNKAFGFSNALYVPRGRYKLGGLALPPKVQIFGDGPQSTALVLGADGATIRMAGAAFDRYAGDGSFDNLAVVMDDPVASVTRPALQLQKVQHMHFNNVLFYHTSIDLDDSQYCRFNRCQFHGGIPGAKLVSRCTFQPAGNQHISTAPTFDQCLFSGNPVDLIDTVEPRFHNCHFFAGDYGIHSWTANAGGGGGKVFYMGPVIIGCTFDSIAGRAIWIEHGGTFCKLIGNFISAGRGQGREGVCLTHCRDVEIANNDFEWCGKDGLVTENCNDIAIIGNKFLNMQNGAGIVASGVTRRHRIIGNSFVNDDHVFGGSAPGAAGNSGIKLAIDTPDSSAVDFLVTNNHLVAMKSAAGLRIEGTGNIVRANQGAPAESEQGWPGGNTAQRPTSARDGYEYFDTTLGKPIYRFAGGWRDATGASV